MIHLFEVNELAGGVIRPALNICHPFHVYQDIEDLEGVKLGTGLEDLNLAVRLVDEFQHFV